MTMNKNIFKITEHSVQSTKSSSVLGIIRRASVLCTLYSVLFISSCQHEEMPPVAKDSLALLPADTPVGMVAELKAQSRAAEADNNTDYDFTLTIPGGSISTQHTGSATVATLGNAFSTLQLNHFNLVEGKSRCVSRWTVLEAAAEGYETLTGVARLTADANGLPTLNYTMQHTGAKVTVVLTNGTTPFSTIDGIGATLTVQNSKGMWKYGNDDLIGYLGDVKAQNSDPAADDANIKLAIVTDATPLSPIAMTSANSTFTTIVPATPDGATLADTDVLTITVPDNYTGLTSPETGGTYTLKLKDVKLADGTNLTALKSGKHLTLTVTLQHNMLVEATATIGGWDEVRADVDLNQDPSKMQPYTYDAATNTYTIKDKQGIVGVWNDMQQHTDRSNATVMYNSLKLKYVDGAAMGVIDGMCGKETGHSAADEAPVIAKITTAIEAGINNFYVINNLATYDLSWQTKTVVGEAFKNCGADNGSITIMLADANKVPSQAFMSCKTLNSVSAPNVITIGDEAFQLCSNIASIDFPAATSIGSYAFENCSAIANVSLPLVASIGDYSFQSCNSLTNVSLPKVTKIGQYAFSSCYNLATLSFGSIIESVGNNPFQSVGSSVGGCALTLASGQQHMTTFNPGTPNGTPVTAADANATEEARSWARRTWKSITIK